MHVKGYCFRSEGMAHPDSRRPQASQPLCSRRDHKPSRWYLSHCVPGTDILLLNTDKESHPGHRTQIENHQSVHERMLGKLQDRSFYLINLFSEFQIPYLYFFLLVKSLARKEIC